VRSPSCVLLSLIPVLGCRSPARVESRPPVEAPSVGATSVDAAAPYVALADGGADSGEVTAPRCRPLVWAEAACVTGLPQPEPMPTETLAQWYADLGAPVPTETLPPQCHEMRVGPSSEAALVCERMNQPFERVGGEDVFRAVLNYVIVTVRKGRAVTLFDRAYYIEVFDKEVIERGPLFALDVELSASGTEVEVRELAPGACAAAAAFLADEERTRGREPDKAARASGLAWTRFDEKLLNRVCAGVGRYVWSGGAFSRAP
jgi:hypothetical protein